MLILKGNKEAIQVTSYYKNISYIYKGDLLLWQAVRSCYGSGVWLYGKPYLYGEPWKYAKR